MAASSNTCKNHHPSDSDALTGLLNLFSACLAITLARLPSPGARRRFRKCRAVGIVVKGMSPIFGSAAVYRINNVDLPADGTPRLT